MKRTIGGKCWKAVSGAVPTASAVAWAAALGGVSVIGSSHREAPLITESPKLDGTDFYMFSSYEAGREDFVTFVANYIPLQDSYGGPNYFSFDPNAVYEIHVDNNGDNVEDITLQFKFQNSSPNVALPIGPEGNQRMNAVPVLAVGQILPGNNAALNWQQTYRVNWVKGPRRTGTGTAIHKAGEPTVTTFTKPMDNIGTKTIPDYDGYANQYIYTISFPETAATGRMFVGQRRDPFVVNLGETFDLVNISTSPLGPVGANKNSLYYKNVTSIIIEVPKASLITGADRPTIGAWMTASKMGTDGTLTQVSRLGQPLVNEVVIGLRDKDKFNASEPKDDGQFADYVTHPTLPAILELLYGAAGVKAPTLFPRTDLIAVFLTGVSGLNANGGLSEMLRLNTSTPATPRNDQKNYGVVAGDNAGFPNGRRPGDDVVDIALRAVMGILLPEAQAPSGQLPFTDGAYVDAKMFSDKFPYINSPAPGSPNEPTITLSLQAAPQVEGPYKAAAVSNTGDPATIETARPAAGAGFFRAASDSRIGLGPIHLKDGNAPQIKVYPASP